jgi:hypothetical protein
MTKKQSNHDQIKKVTIDYDNLSNIEKTKLIFLFDLFIRLFNAISPLRKYDIPFFFEGFALLKTHLEKVEKDIHLGELSFRYETLPSIETKTPNEIFADIDRTLGPLDIQSQNILEVCLKCLTSLLYLRRDNLKMTDDDNYSYVVCEEYVKARSFEALGYWTAKIKRNKQNDENVKARTNIKEKRKAQLREWMKTISTKDCRLKAQKEFGITDRAVLNYLKEIKDEKTAFLRKKDVPA